MASPDKKGPKWGRELGDGDIGDIEGEEMELPPPFLSTLEEPVKSRVKSLKKLQHEWAGIEFEFFAEMHKLELKYQSRYHDLYDKRKAIIIGDHLPSKDECDWPTDEEASDTEEGTKRLNKLTISEEAMKVANESIKGVPKFWLQVLKSSTNVADMIQEHDEPILEHLQDVRCFLLTEPMGFRIEFHFGENDYFTNNVLTKTYHYNTEMEKYDTDCSGYDAKSTDGCTINWQKGKNVTIKVVKKTQKHKQKNQQRTVTKTVKADSFFNFFSPPMGGENEDEEDEDIMAVDYEIGCIFRDTVCSRAVLMYCGEYEDEDDMLDFEDSDEDEDDDEIEDEDGGGDDVAPRAARGHRGRVKKSSRSSGGTDKAQTNNVGAKATGQGDGEGKEEPNECKQQ